MQKDQCSALSVVVNYKMAVLINRGHQTPKADIIGNSRNANSATTQQTCYLQVLLITITPSVPLPSL